MLARLLNSWLNHYRNFPYWRGIIRSGLDSTLTGIIYFLPLWLVTERGFTSTQAGCLLSCYGIGSVAGGWTSGYLSDRYAPRYILTISLLMQGIVFLFLPFMNVFLLMSCALAVLGINASAFITANNLCTLNNCNHSESGRLKALSLLNTASNAGLGLSALFVWALHPLGFESIFYISGIMFLVMTVWILKQKINENVPHRRQIGIENKTRYTERKNYFLITVVLSSVFLVGMIIGQRKTVWLLYLHQHFPHAGTIFLPALFAINPVLIVLTQAPITGLLGKFNNKILLSGTGALLMGSSMLLLYLSDTIIPIITCCIIYTLGEIIFFPMAQLTMYQASPEHTRGQYMGLFRSMYTASIIAGPLTGGYIYHQFGEKILGSLNGLMGLVCLILCLSLFYPVKAHDVTPKPQSA